MVGDSLSSVLVIFRYVFFSFFLSAFPGHGALRGEYVVAFFFLSSLLCLIICGRFFFPFIVFVYCLIK